MDKADGHILMIREAGMRLIILHLWFLMVEDLVVVVVGPIDAWGLDAHRTAVVVEAIMVVALARAAREEALTSLILSQLFQIIKMEMVL